MPRLHYDPDRDYYDLLNIPTTASPADVRRAFHEQAKTCHPDLNVERLEWANETFQILSDAYHTLSDPDRRREYDRLRWPHVAQSEPEPAQSSAQNNGQTTAEHAATMRRGHWNYGNLEENEMIADYPEMGSGNLWQTVRALLRGPFGKVYLLAAIMFLMLTLLVLIVEDWRDSVQSASCPYPQAQITDPEEDAMVPTEFPLYGTAQADDFAGYRVERVYLGASGDDAQSAIPITAYGNGAYPVTDDLLVEAIRLTDGPGVYLLRLEVIQGDDHTLLSCERRVVLAE